MDVSYSSDPVTLEQQVDVPASVSLTNIVKKEVHRLLDDLNEDSAADLYGVIINQMDAGIIEALIDHTKNNQSMATRILGLARGTVRKKWSIYTKTKQEESKR